MFILWKFQQGDFSEYCSLVFHEAVMNKNFGRVFTQDEAQMFFSAMLAQNENDGPLGFYRVHLQDTGRFAGMFATTREDGGDIEVSYMLLPEYWGQGIGTKLLENGIALLNQSFPGAGLIAITEPHNIASVRVLEKNGFSLTREYVNPDGDDVLEFRLQLVV